MPMTSPADDTSAPPELPGLSAASVWITSSIGRPCCAASERPSAETTPAVTVEWKPSGLPIATAIWPRLSVRCRRAGGGEAAGAVRLQRRQVGVGVGAEHAGAQPRGRRRRRRSQRGRAVDDVMVGDDQAVGRDRRRRSPPPRPLDGQRADRRADAVGDALTVVRIGVEQAGVAGILAMGSLPFFPARNGNRGGCLHLPMRPASAAARRREARGQKNALLRSSAMADSCDLLDGPLAGHRGRRCARPPPASSA